MNTQKYFSNATTYYYYLICAKITTVCANDFSKKKLRTHLQQLNDLKFINGLISENYFVPGNMCVRGKSLSSFSQ